MVVDCWLKGQHVALALHVVLKVRWQKREEEDPFVWILLWHWLVIGEPARTSRDVIILLILRVSVSVRPLTLGTLIEVP